MNRNKLVIISAIVLFVLIMWYDTATYKSSSPTVTPTVEQCEQLSRIIKEIK